MRAKYFNGKVKVDRDIIKEIARGIVEGKSVIFPTETVYGIGTNAFDREACEGIFSAKERSNDKPLIVLISDFNMLKSMVDNISQVEQKLIEAFWPGPLTIIFKKNKDIQVPDVVTAGKSNIGIRMTSGDIAKALIQEAKVPIVAPSANLSGKPTGVKIENIIKELGDKVDYILDCGNIESDTTSTVVEVRDNVIYVIRQGKVSIEELRKIAETRLN